MIEANSVSFRLKNYEQKASAGFSNDEVKTYERYIAYLKKSTNGYVLTESSNQYMEWIREMTRKA